MSERRRPRGSTPGTTDVSSKAVERLISVAVEEVVGVHRLRAAPEYPPMSGLAQDVYREVRATRGVKVEIDGLHVTAAVALYVEFGHDLDEVADAVKAAAADAVSKLTALSVVEVNVHIVDVRVPDPEIEEGTRQGD